MSPHAGWPDPISLCARSKAPCHHHHHHHPHYTPCYTHPPTHATLHHNCKDGPHTALDQADHGALLFSPDLKCELPFAPCYTTPPTLRQQVYKDRWNTILDQTEHAMAQIGINKVGLPADMGAAERTKALTASVMALLPADVVQETYVSEALHFRRGIQNFQVRRTLRRAGGPASYISHVCESCALVLLGPCGLRGLGSAALRGGRVLDPQTPVAGTQRPQPASLPPIPHPCHHRRCPCTLQAGGGGGVRVPRCSAVHGCVRPGPATAMPTCMTTQRIPLPARNATASVPLFVWI